MSLRLDVIQRLKQFSRTARMWGSPAECEAALIHLAHIFFIAEDPQWTLKQTIEAWRGFYSHSEADEREHQKMRSRFWGDSQDLAFVQVVQGYVVLLAAAPRNDARDPVMTPHIELLIDHPHTAGTPEALNAALFTLMGFLSSDVQRFAHLLSLERLRVGGHELRPLHVVAPAGPSEAALPYAYDFKDWPRLTEAIDRFVAHLMTLNA